MRQLSKLDYRIPLWELKSLVERACPICNYHGEPIFQRPDQLIVNKCYNCSTYYISPGPDNESLTDFYSTYHDKYSRLPKLSSEQLKQNYDKINPLADIRIRKLTSLLNIENTTVLDIGFGQPFLLYLLKKLGAHTYGIDIDPKAIEYAKYLEIHSVFEGDFSLYSSQIKFDLIVMTDFVEHPILPLEYINKAISLLKPTGIILIWTPNGDAEIKTQEPITFRVDLEHMQYFTSGTILYLANKSDLRVLHLETLGQPALVNIENESNNEKVPSKLKIYEKFRRLIKRVIRKYILKEDYQTNFFPLEGGNYNLFAILSKN
jgi:2-polyprenyl-3-methyl-5-hydroxy-6-metoxy-1,4-benzoquinol methylase